MIDEERTKAALIEEPRAARALRRYERIVSCSDDMMAALDREYVYVVANDAYLKAFGKARSELIGRTVSDIFGEEFFEAVIKPNADRCMAGHAVRYTEWFDFPVGARRYMDVEYSLYSADGGENEGFSVIARDITEHKRAEDELKARLALEGQIGRISAELAMLSAGQVDRGIERALQSIAQHSGATRGSVFILSDDLTTITNTHEWCADPADSQLELLQDIPAETFGYYLRLLRQHHNVVVTRLEDLPVAEAAAERRWAAEHGFRPLLFVPLISAGGLRGTIGLYGGVGQQRQWSNDFVALFRFIGDTVLHVVERKRAEEALQASEQRFDVMFEKHSSVMLLIEPESGRIVAANAAAALFYGYPKSELMKMSIQEINQLDPEEVAFRRRQAAAGSCSFVFPHKAKSGKLCTVEVHSSPIEHLGRNLLFSIVHDVTERERAEAARSQLEEQLYQSQKMEAIGRLAGGVAHDFNNVLCAILGNAELALRGLSVRDPLYESMEEIIGAASRASDLTRQLLAFSRKQVIDPKVINLSHVIESLHSMLTRLIGEQITLRTVPQKRLGRVCADPSQIEQIVLNLAVNARDAMPDGGELLIETADVKLDQDYCDKYAGASPGAYVMLAVSDTGCGMSAEVREKVFEPFFTTKQLGQGTGLGLATVFGIVEQSGGRIEVDSSPGEGTSFKAYFPRVADKAEPLSRSETAGPVGGKETVLLVEDEEIVRNVSLRLLERLGYKVLAASSGGDAIAIAERHGGSIDLLLTDVVMPHMNGRELSVRLVEGRPGLKVLYTSGYTQDVIGQHGVLDRGVQFIAKPYSLDALAARVRAVLDSPTSQE